VTPDFQFDLSKPIAPAVVESAVAQPISNQDRLVAARKNHMALNKESRRYGGFGCNERDYRDFAGPDTSYYDFSNAAFLLNFLQEPKFGNLFHRLEDGTYLAQLAQWQLRLNAEPMKFSPGTSAPPATVTLAELRVALAARIRELAISEVLLAEWMAIPHGIEGGQAFDRLPFAEKMNRFRVESL
jgi:hypothetical protein